jgi:hypothetical protein
MTVEELVLSLRPGCVWVNKHNGDETTIQTFAHRDEVGIGWCGEVRIPACLVVHHSVNAPPGFTQGYGDDLESFVLHWCPR